MTKMTLNLISGWCSSLQAVEEMDAGDIWATKNFPVPCHGSQSEAGKAPGPAAASAAGLSGPLGDGCGVTKSWLYQSRVVDAAMTCLWEAIAKYRSRIAPKPLNYADPAVKGTLMPAMKQSERAVNFGDTAPAVVRKIRVSGTACETALPF